MKYQVPVIGKYLHGFEKRVLPDINRQSSLGEKWEQGVRENS